MDPAEQRPPGDDDGAGVAHCAVHLDAPATLTCRHRGAYACPECEVVTPWGTRLCAACAAAGRDAYRVPFEQGGGLYATARAIGTAPRTIFARMGGGPRAPLGRALLFATLAARALGGALVAVDGIAVLASRHEVHTAAGSRWALGYSEREIFLVLSMTMIGALSTGVFGALGAGSASALLARLLGGALPLRAALRGALYTRATWLLASPFLLVTLLQEVSPFIRVTVLGLLVSHEVVAHRALLGSAGLTSVRAWTAALGAVAVGLTAAVVAMLACWFGLSIVMFIGRLIAR